MEFEINFLTRNKSAVWIELLKKTWLIVVLLAVGFGFVLLLVKVRLPQNTGKLVTSGQEFVRITLEREKASELKKTLSQLKDDRTGWTEKLIYLSDVTPKQIFLTSFEFEKERAGTGNTKGMNREKLIIRGVVLSPAGEDSSSAIQKFMKDLKNNPSFMAGFDDPVLVSVNHSQQEVQGEGLEFEFQLLRKLEG